MSASAPSQSVDKLVKQINGAWWNLDPNVLRIASTDLIAPLAEKIQKDGAATLTNDETRAICRLLRYAEFRKQLKSSHGDLLKNFLVLLNPSIVRSFFARRTGHGWRYR